MGVLKHFFGVAPTDSPDMSPENIFLKGGVVRVTCPVNCGS